MMDHCEKNNEREDNEKDSSATNTIISCGGNDGANGSQQPPPQEDGGNVDIAAEENDKNRETTDHNNTTTTTIMSLEHSDHHHPEQSSPSEPPSSIVQNEIIETTTTRTTTMTTTTMDVSSASATTTAITDITTDNATTSINGSGISGKGMWEAWTRSFDTPLLAFLDLLDNAVDASWTLLLKEKAVTTSSNTNNKKQNEDEEEEEEDNDSIMMMHQKKKKKKKPKIQIDIDNQIGEGGVLMRNASTYIPPLSQVLQVYKSNKGSRKDSIGENGIGVKHACAALCDVSFVFVKRNLYYMSVGIIMKELQEDDQIVLPSMEWHHSINIIHELQLLCTVTHPHTWGVALTAFGNGDLEDGINNCFRHMMALQEGEWKEYSNVFAVVLNELKHEGKGSSSSVGGVGVAANDDDDVTNIIMDLHQETKENYILNENGDYVRRREKKTAEEKSKELLMELQKKMSYLYLHLNHFDIRIQRKPIVSNHWEKRLIELTKFDLEIPMDEHWTKVHETLYKNDRVINIKNANKSIRFFCGFNPFRATGEDGEADPDGLGIESDLGMNGGRNVNSASLKVYWYSRQSGRLIKVDHDPRSSLGLGSGSTRFNQGLTIIIDDYNGTIPLNPTKQDTSFGQTPYGQIHSDNIQEWTAAITHFYWMYHFEQVGGESKRALSEAIASRKAQIRALNMQQQQQPAQQQQDVPSFSISHFIQYANLHFNLNSRKGGNHSIRANKIDRNKCYPTFMGNADMSNCPLIRLDEEAAHLKLQDEAAKKVRKRQHTRTKDDDEEEEEEETEGNVENGMEPRNYNNPTKRQKRVPRRQNRTHPDVVVVAANNAREGRGIEGGANARVHELEQENVKLQQEIVQMKQALEEQGKEMAKLQSQRDDETFRADKLEQELTILQNQNMKLLRNMKQTTPPSIRASSSSSSPYFETNGTPTNNGTPDRAVPNSKSLLFWKQQAEYYRNERESAKKQIQLLREENDRMQARMQILEESQSEQILEESQSDLV